MSLFNEFWKIVSAAWAQIAQSLTCFLLNARLRVVVSQIEGARRYISAVKDNSTNFTKNLAKYFEEQLPTWLGERESLEAQLEINGCEED